jgi:hypothetical protein
MGWVSEIVKETDKCIAAIAENQTTSRHFEVPLIPNKMEPSVLLQ